MQTRWPRQHGIWWQKEWYVLTRMQHTYWKTAAFFLRSTHISYKKDRSFILQYFNKPLSGYGDKLFWWTPIVLTETNWRCNPKGHPPESKAEIFKKLLKMLQKEQAFIDSKWVSKQNEQNYLKKKNECLLKWVY